MNFEKYLPIGTVVLLKNGKKRIMITGLTAQSESTGDRIYDYMGCLYPEGVISTEQTLVFDHNQIDKIYYMGYVDKEWKELKEKLMNFSSTLENK